MKDSLTVQWGTVLVYRVFDVAEEIDLNAVERLLAAGDSRLRLSKQGRHAMIIRNAPVRVSLGDLDVQLRGETVRCEALATVWDYGVISICFQIPIPPGTSWTGLVRLAEAINSSGNGADEIDALATRKSIEVARQLKPALKKPGEWNVSEDYVIFFLEQISGITKASDLLQRADVPALILSEAKDTLAPKAREGILENVFQYAEDDLAVIDWNSALIVEPTGVREITDVLEFAVTHLLELRYYDDLLDKRMTELYDSIEERRAHPIHSYFSKLSNDANTRFLEFSEFIERVDNSLKVVGDFYFATIFRAAVKRFRIADWQNSINRKLNLLARVSELLQGETNVFRSHLLELIIIFLILFEILSAIGHR